MRRSIMIKAGIFGGTGYMGGEALRILLQHPQVEVAWVTSRSGTDIALYHPNLYGLKVNHGQAGRGCALRCSFPGLANRGIH